MTITVTFDPPLPSDTPAVFDSKAFTLLGDLNDWSTEANALQADVNAKEATASSAATTASTAAGTASSAASTATTKAADAETARAAAVVAKDAAEAAAVAAATFDPALFVAKAGETMTGPLFAPNLRDKLTVSRTYHVRSDGNDSNSGLVDSAGGAFLTIQKAVDVASALDLGSSNVIIQVGGGTFTGATLRTFSGAGTITIQGDTSNPSSRIISAPGGNCFFSSGVTGTYAIRGLQLSGNVGLNLNNYSRVLVGNVIFGTMSAYGIYCNAGAVASIDAAITISGSSVWFVYASGLGVCNIFSGVTVTLTGTPAFSGGFANCDRLSALLAYGVTFSGSATGPRYQVVHNSLIFTNGGGASYLPGNSAGSAATGGQYV